jgi:succinoglycan biosynthesis transport protein ExoP
LESTQYVRAVLRSSWLVFLTLLAGGVGGYIAFHGETPLYRSSIRMIVATTTGGLDPVAASTIAGQRAEILAQVAPTAPAIQDALTAAGQTKSAGGLSVSASSSGPFVTVLASSPHASVANAVANAFLNTLDSSTVRLAGPTSTPLKLTSLAPATYAAHPYSPKPKRDVGLGLAAGLVLGIALAILRQALNTSVRDSDELQELTGLTVLGTVPRDLPKKPLPAASDPRSARAEGYRQVRTTLLNQSEKHPRTIAVTSATLGEGKTSVACNLAVVMGRAGHRVALVDADMRRPQVAAYFDLEPDQAGLAEVLAGTESLDRALQAFDSGRLAVLTAGRIPKEPSESLGSENMANILDQLALDYEFVIVDTPPVLPVTDGLVICPQVDGVILVVRLERTTRNQVKHAIGAIDRVNGELVGVVPNQAGAGRDVDYGYPYRNTAGHGKGTRSRSNRSLESSQDNSETGNDIGAGTAESSHAVTRGTSDR